jgi:hypothetical protein
MVIENNLSGHCLLLPPSDLASTQQCTWALAGTNERSISGDERHGGLRIAVVGAGLFPRCQYAVTRRWSGHPE